MKKFQSLIGIAAAGAIGLTAGTSYALWHDSDHFTSQIQMGKVAFGVGDPGKVVGDSSKFTTDGSALSYTIGKDAANELVKNKAVAIPIEVDSMAQGTTGLRYTVKPDSWSTGVFGESNTTFFKVTNPNDCTVDNSSASATDLTSTPVNTEYKTSKEPVKEYWCIVAKLKDTKLGTYTNEATVTGQDDTNNDNVSGNDSWSANVVKNLQPDKEPNHDITFTPELFRG